MGDSIDVDDDEPKKKGIGAVSGVEFDFDDD